MKILCIGHSLGHYRQRAMWEWIANEGHLVETVVMPQYQDEKYEPITKGSFRQNLVGIYSSETPNFWYFPAIHDMIHKINPDIVFCYQEPWTAACYYTMMSANMFRIPFGFFTWENIDRLLPNPYRRIQSDVIHNSSLIVAGNTDSARMMLNKGGDFVVKELQTGLDPNLMIPSPKLVFSEPKEERKILFVGRLVPEKGIETILRAFEKLEGNYKLRFVGGRGNMADLITNHPAYHQGKITLEPWVTYEKLPEIYSWGDVSLMPSIDTDNWREQGGYVVPESLLCHIPVITSYSKSIVEWWKLPDVHFIQQGDADMLADALMDDSIYREAKEGRKAVIEKYSNSVIGQNYLDMFEEVI